MQIAVRIDDITPDMDWDSFLKFKELLDKYGIKPLIGVVPDNRDDNLKKSKSRDDFWNDIKELQEAGWSIAQHGYQHIYATKKGGLFPLNHFSEFAGLPYEKQLEMLQAGHDILRKNGITTNIFMAPGHSYDKNTIKALKHLNFSYVTDGFARKTYQRGGLLFLPIAYRRSKCFTQKEGVTTLVYHINGMKEEQFRQYERELSKVKGMPPYSQLLEQTPQQYSVVLGIKERSMAVWKHYMVKLLGGR